MDDIQESHITHLLQHFAKNVYKATNNDSYVEETMNRCKEILGKDYTFRIVSNSGGELSHNYPSQLPVLISDKEKDGASPNLNPERMKEQFTRARLARVRSRFPMPVILVNGKYICRSATLSGGPEIYTRSGVDLILGVQSTVDEDKEWMEEIPMPVKEGEWQLFDKVRTQDIKLLKMFEVQTIIDLMVEKKKVKFGVNVTSSEKVDKEKRYSEFRIVSLPYPGCEFFKEFRDMGYNGEGLLFDWSRPYIDAHLDVPEDTVSSKLEKEGIEWKHYKTWDLVVLSQNYMKLLLNYIQTHNGSLLVHCISGWDRTPLFVSILRLSLWADGLIHTSLDATQMLYLTIAYDWYLFGHDLCDRLNKGEEIFFFCFYFLKFIVGKEFRCSKKKSSGVRHNDSDLGLENSVGGLLLESCGSSTSLNSSCSSVSSRSQDNPPMYFHVPPQSDDDLNACHHAWPSSSLENSNHGYYSNGTSYSHLQPQSSPNPTRAVPVPKAIRTRHESCNSSGSWQLVTNTGSLRGTSTCCSSSQLSLNTPSSAEDCIDSSVMTVVENPASSTASTRRKERLQEVRTLFYHVYSQSIGYHFQNNSDAGITGLIGGVAEKLGIRSTQRTLSS